LIKYCIPISHFRKSMKEPKTITLPKFFKYPKFLHNLRSISLLSTTTKLLQKVMLKTVQRHTDERYLLNASQFGFLALRNTTLQCMRVIDHATLNFNNNMSTPEVFFDIDKSLWHSGYLYKISKWNFRPVWSNLLVIFSRKENSEFW
jgi:hypothetical protein